MNFLKGWQELGLDTSPDINSGDASGAVAGPWSIDATKQTRSDARVTTFVTTYPRPRIHIVNNMRVTKLVLAPEVSGQPRRVAGFNVCIPFLLSVAKLTNLDARSKRWQNILR